MYYSLLSLKMISFVLFSFLSLRAKNELYYIRKWYGALSVSKLCLS